MPKPKTGKTPAAPLLAQLSLWPHQSEAINRMRHYIAEFQAGNVEGSALVHMPTGSGKTGVIATIARCLPEVGCTLILAPRIALREQLARDIQSRFFEHLSKKIALDKLPKKVVEIAGDDPIPEIEDYESTILVSTIQKIHSMANNSLKWEELASHISLVIVDEGHYEPAASWSIVLRSFKTPKIIFTATPYRNDLKFFDINLKHVFIYTFHQAAEDGFLRDVEIVTQEPTRDPNKFVTDLLAFYDKKFSDGKGDKPRVIIRCERQEEIRQIAAILKKHKRDYIAIHERFSDKTKKSKEQKSVPDPSKESATFWIHQFKLLEGIDDNRFQVLALFDPLQNARSLVQQIGRIIRNPGRKPGSKGYVLDHSPLGRQLQLWMGYLKYDQALSQHGEKALNLAIGKGWLTNLFQAQPICSYMGDRFRVPLDLEELDPQQDLVLPRMVNLRHKGKDFDIDKFCEVLEKSFLGDDREFRRYDQEGSIVYLYITFNNSPLLENAYFLEPKLGVTILRVMKDVVAYYDSSGHLPVDLFEAGLGEVVDAYELKKLFSANNSSRLTAVSLRNANLGPNTIRSHSISAGNIHDTVSAFDDHAQVCTTATGYSPEPNGKEVKWLRRYIGFDSGRVSQSSKPCPLYEYETWTQGVAQELKQTVNPTPTFRRYAEEHKIPEDTTPKHILLDLQEVQDKYLSTGTTDVSRDEVLNPVDLSCEIEEYVEEEAQENNEKKIADQPKYSFTFQANNISWKIFIRYAPDLEKYILDSPELDKAYYNKDSQDKRSIISYLNQNQAFRVIPATENFIYTLGRFYQPLFKVGKGFDPELFDVCQVLTKSSKLASVKDEKYENKDHPTKEKAWTENTLFGIIKKLGGPAGLQEFFGNPDILICDDMRTEAADFIMADTKRRRVVFIHAKASSTKKPYSASALQEVISQATKNINYLGMYNESIPPNLKDWDKGWPDGKNPKIPKRILISKLKGEKAWEKIQSIIRHPLADREVWLFLGSILSKSQFEANLAKDPPTPETLQAAYLLRSALTTVASVGAKLRVFCYP